MRKKNNRESKATSIDYKKLLKFIGLNKPKKVAEWLEENHRLPGYDLNQACNYQGKSWTVMTLLLDKFEKGLVGEEMYELIKKYGPMASDHDYMPIILKDLKNLIKNPRTMDLNIIDEITGYNLIHRIIDSNDPSLFEYIPELQKRGVKINHLDKKGFPPFYLALRNDRLPALKYLAELKANLSYSKEGSNDALSLAASHGQMQICEFLETKMPKKQVRSSYFKVMCVAIKANKEQTVMRLLGKVDINAFSDDFKMTPLMIAVKTGPEIFRVLLEHKADPFIKNTGFGDHNVLAAAVYCENAAIITMLFDYFQRLESTSTELKNKVSSFLTQSGALYVAVSKKTTDMLQLLVEKKMDINQSDEKICTSLVIAIKKQNLQTVCFLLDHPSFNLERSTRNISIYFPLVNLTQNTYITIRIALYFKIPIPLGLHEKILQERGNDELIRLVYANTNTELNIFRHEQTTTALELFIRYKRYQLIQWLLETRIHELNNAAIVRALAISRILNDRTITLMMRNFFLPQLSPLIMVEQIREALREKKFGFALTFLPELEHFIKSPYLQRFGPDPAFLICCVFYITQRFDIALLPWEQPFNSDLQSIPSLKDYLNLARNNPQALSCLYNFLKKSPSTLPLTHENPSILITSSSIPSFTPLRFLTEEKRFSKEEAKALIDSRFNVFNDRAPLPAITHEAKKTFQWLDYLSSERLNLFPIEGGAPNCFLLIPTELRMPGSERLLTKSRWRFSPVNGIKSIELQDAPVDVTFHLNIDQTVKIIKLKRKYWTYEITTPSTKNRILCFSITSPSGGMLIVAGYFLKGGLHVACPNLPARVEFSVQQLSNKLGSEFDR